MTRKIPEHSAIRNFIHENLTGKLYFGYDESDGAVRIDNAGHVTLTAFAESVTECNQFDKLFRRCASTFGRISTYSFSAKSNGMDDGREYFEVECEFDTL